ncbi:MAG: hypothetical protein DMD81_26245 [Candidatus Rokuibacteriota bacterium]|nr:MAG: hypothetical protein DMD81_26245 [Candidatus Rokubacteria bacterium]
MQERVAPQGEEQRRLANAWLDEGVRLDDAERFADQALALSRDRGERGGEIWALWLQGEIAFRRGPDVIELAAERYEQALALATELGMRPLMAHCHAGLARAVGAEDHLACATALYREMEMTFWLSRANA